MSFGRDCSYAKDMNLSKKGKPLPLLEERDLKSYCSSLIAYKKSREDGYGGVKNPSIDWGKNNKLPPDCKCLGSAAGGKKKTRKVKKSKNKKTKRKQTKKVKKTRRNRKGKK